MAFHLTIGGKRRVWCISPSAVPIHPTITNYHIGVNRCLLGRGQKESLVVGPWRGKSEDNMMGRKSEMGHMQSARDYKGQVSLCQKGDLGAHWAGRNKGFWWFSLPWSSTAWVTRGAFHLQRRELCTKVPRSNCNTRWSEPPFPTSVPCFHGPLSRVR